VHLEQQEATKKKIEAYNQLCQDAFARKKAGDKTKEALESTTQVLGQNGDFYTLWNYRRTILLEMLKEMTEEEKEKTLQSELKFVEQIIPKYHKSYCVWEHRKWLTLGQKECNWRRELELCAKLLSVDARNFHCWNYRGFVLKHSNAEPSVEIEFLTKKIQENFSNYSSWHRRTSTILEMHKNNPEDLPAAIDKELEFVSNAFYTEPGDQSGWLYYRWLVEVVKHPLSVLRRELGSMNEFLAMEPDSKWALITKVFLLDKLQQQQPETASIEESVSILDRLVTIDPMHANYYKDLSKKLQKEQAERLV